MYCVNCGIKLEDTEKKCPLCGIVPYHPDIQRKSEDSLYPPDRYPKYKMNPMSIMIIIITAFLIPAAVCLLCDFEFSGGIVWSGYVIGSLALGYTILILPFWFKKPNPIVFIPCDFAAILLYLFYICLKTDGSWFFTFALPVGAMFALIVTAVVALIRYLKKGHLYILGGAFICLGAFTVLVEFFLNLTFSYLKNLFWSFYPLTALVLLGAMLIFLAACKPARESMERKFFI